MWLKSFSKITPDPMASLLNYPYFKNKYCFSSAATKVLSTSKKKVRTHWGEALSSFSNWAQAQQGLPSTGPHHHLGPQAHLYVLSLHPAPNEVNVKEDKINAIIKAVIVNTEPFWPGLFVKALANVKIKILTCDTQELVSLTSRSCCTRRRCYSLSVTAPVEEKKG